MSGMRWWVHGVYAVITISKLKGPADLCKYINGVQIWARATYLEDICEERIIVAIGVNGLPAGLHREWGTVSKMNSIQNGAEISRLTTFIPVLISKVKQLDTANHYVKYLIKGL